jgi:hypothetical protein
VRANYRITLYVEDATAHLIGLLLLLEQDRRRAATPSAWHEIDFRISAAQRLYESLLDARRDLDAYEDHLRGADAAAAQLAQALAAARAQCLDPRDWHRMYRQSEHARAAADLLRSLGELR